MESNSHQKSIKALNTVFELVDFLLEDIYQEGLILKESFILSTGIQN